MNFKDASVPARRDRAAAALVEAAALKAAPRRDRITRLPVRIVAPPLLGRLNMQREVQSRMFWGGMMNVIVPESVSVSLYRYGFFDDDVCHYLLRFLKPGMTFIDVGGHFGFFSLLGSWLAGEKGRVVTFEPMPQTYKFLTRNLATHAAYNNYAIVNAAAYDEETVLQFNDFGLVNSAYNSAFSSRGGDWQGEPVTCQARRIDDVVDELGIETVDIMKIDAESSELRALRGMAKLIERCRPKIILEVGDFSISGVPTSREIVEWLTARGYRPYSCRPDGTIEAQEVMSSYATQNLLFTASGLD